MASVWSPENGCASCHEINGIKKPENFAPGIELASAANLFTQLIFLEGVDAQPARLTWLRKISNPRAFGPALKMPQYNFTPQQVDAITTALLGPDGPVA